MKIKNTPKLKKEITRKCVICGGNILVNIHPDGKYVGGNYFGVSLPKSASTPHSSTPEEYWECDKCYNGWGNHKESKTI